MKWLEGVWKWKENPLPCGFDQEGPLPPPPPTRSGCWPGGARAPCPAPKLFPSLPVRFLARWSPSTAPRPPGVGVGKAVRGTESLPTNLATLACSCWGRGWWRPLHLTPRCRLRSLRSLRPTLSSVTVFAGKARQTPRQPLRGRQGSATRRRYMQLWQYERRPFLGRLNCMVLQSWGAL